MKTKLMYVADDGTSFDTEKECIDYEKSTNKYVVLYKDKETDLIKREFADESSAKRFIANSLHDCYEDSIVGNFKLIHCGKTVEFNSNELAHLVPAHYNIDGDKLNKVFQMSTTKNVKIPGYTLHGDYYLADKVVRNRNWKQSQYLKVVVDLPDGKKVVAHTLSKDELETIPEEERKCDNWYWTRTDYGIGLTAYGFFVREDGSIDYRHIIDHDDAGGVRLGFKNPFIN